MSIRAAYRRLRQEALSAKGYDSQVKLGAILARLFHQQRDFVLDPARRKALLCGRRAGKSYSAAAYLYATALRRKKAKCLFLTLTRERAKEILWGEVKNLNQEFELGCRFNETSLTATLPNGSTIRLTGCDSKSEIDKFRGVPYHLVIIDETKSFDAKLLKELLEEAIEPALTDYRGSLVIMGTPGSVLDGPFYDATGHAAFSVFRDDNGERRAVSRPYSDRAKPGWSDVKWEWSFHGWNVSDNSGLHPFDDCPPNCDRRHLWEEDLELKARKGWSDDSPIWVREYLGRWLANDSDLVYPFNAERNTWKPGPKTPDNPFGLPRDHRWHYILGVDLGFRDAFALQVVAYSPTHPNFYQVYEYTERGLHLTPIIVAVKKAQALCGGRFDAAVGDYAGASAAKTLFSELATVHGVVIEPAQKVGKRDHVDIVADDLIEGRCKLLADSQLVREMKGLVWEDKTKGKEQEGLPNDNCDAFLYTRVHAWHHLWQEPVKPVEYGSKEYFDSYEAEAVRLAEEAELRKYDTDGTDDWDRAY